MGRETLCLQRKVSYEKSLDLIYVQRILLKRVTRITRCGVENKPTKSIASVKAHYLSDVITVNELEALE